MPALLRHALRGAPATPARIVHDGAGAPLLQDSEGDPLPWLPSVSHSAEACGLILSAGERPGLDTEPASRPLRTSALLRRVASAASAARIAALSPPESRAELLRRWTRVEAVLKATGAGFGALAEIDVEEVASGGGVAWRHRQLQVLSWRWGGQCWSLACDAALVRAQG